MNLLALGRKAGAVLVWGCVLDSPVQGASEPQVLPEVEVAADRAVPLRAISLERSDWETAPQRSLDGLLRQVPGFSLYRRTDSLVAHPTSQGASLGNTGPNGASRAVLFWDGVPMNDPFGGWIPWNRFPTSWLARVWVTPCGRAGFNAPGGLCGTVDVRSRFLEEPPFRALEFAAGSLVEHQVSAGFSEDLAGGRVRMFGGVQEMDFRGYSVLREDQRGRVDTKAKSRVRSGEGGFRYAFSEEGDWKLTLRVQGYEEARGNGTPLAVNRGDGVDFSVRLEREGLPDEWSGQWTWFHQARRFQSTFTSVSADRSAESVTLDQYAVPSRCTGLFQRVRVPLGERHVLGVAWETQVVEGVTRERFRNLGAGFTREREAGGLQIDSGLSVADTWTLRKGLSLTGSVRTGWHRDQDGMLREWDRASGAVTASRREALRQRVPVDLGLSGRWQASAELEVEGGIFTCRRQPTLNELYRPFRVGNTLTLANPGLLPERVEGLDAGARWSSKQGFVLRGRVFYQQLRQAIANVTEVTGPGVYPEWGALGVGGVGARRENVDRIRMPGFELGTEVRLPLGISVDCSWLHVSPRVMAARVDPRLVGCRPPQAPREVVQGFVKGGNARWRWEIGVRAVSSQFEDDRNERKLAAFTTLNGMVTCKLHRRCEVYVGGENLTGSEIQTRRDADGIVAVGAPLSWISGVRCEF
jgi:outer membrane receptor protein involved in Fe transport